MKTRCQSNKKGYASQENALLAIACELKKYGMPIQPYKCPMCSDWHVRTKRKKATIRRRLIKKAIKKYIKLSSMGDENNADYDDQDQQTIQQLPTP